MKKINLTPKQRDLLILDFKDAWDADREFNRTNMAEEFAPLDKLAYELSLGVTVTVTPQLIIEAEYHLDKLIFNPGMENRTAEMNSYRALVRKAKQALGG